MKEQIIRFVFAEILCKFLHKYTKQIIHIYLGFEPFIFQNYCII